VGDATELLAVHLPDEGGERQLDEDARAFEAARRQWEYSHAASAVFTF
jgi:hypothetical protein